MTHRHPENIPVVEYYARHGVNYTYCWRAGCTSITTLALNDDDTTTLDEAPEECILLLKNPLERFRSAQMILPDEARNVDGDRREIMRCPIDEYVDAILDGDENYSSPHVWPQLWQHRAVKNLSVYRLEGSTHLAGAKLPYLNVTTEDKEVLTHRLDELKEFYAADIAAWEEAVPSTMEIL